MTKNIDRKLITAKETAQRLGCTVRNIRKLCAQGKIQDAVKLKGQWFMPWCWSDYGDNYKYIQSIPLDYMFRMKKIQQEMRHEAVKTFNRIRSLTSVRAGMERLAKLQTAEERVFNAMMFTLTELGEPPAKPGEPDVHYRRFRRLERRLQKTIKESRRKAKDGRNAED